jgi:ABC-type nitrate/sulfonate/bicarbonate transport system permease component
MLWTIMISVSIGILVGTFLGLLMMQRQAAPRHARVPVRIRD